MAILKHISSKSSNYSEAIDYLTCKYNETTNQPILDENGHLTPREEYYIDGINCDPYSFDIECRELNKEWHKNQNKADIKSHHYIISFDPKDKTECGLTGEQAQEIGKEFATKFFPGHQCLVATHTDGNNESGNIHCHIVINSLRKFDVDREDWMDRPSDNKAGFKHHLSDECLEHFKKELMEICQREHLNQVDLINPAKVKITDREYKAQQRGQRKLDRESIKQKKPPTQFQTQKQYIRDAIDDIASSAKTMQEFYTKLEEKYIIKVSESRGRFSYLHPDRERNIADKSLGTDYERTTILERIRENAERAKQAEKDANVQLPTFYEPPEEEQEEEHDETWYEHHQSHEYDEEYDYRSDPEAIIYITAHLKLLSQIQAKLDETGIFKTHWQKNKEALEWLKAFADTVTYILDNHIDTEMELRERHTSAMENLTASQKQLSDIKDEMQDVNTQIHYLGSYLSNRKTYREFVNSKNKGLYRTQHKEAIDDFEEARKVLREFYPDGKFPTLDSLRKEKTELQKEQKNASKACRNYKNMEQDLSAVYYNLGSFFNSKVTYGGGKAKEQSRTTTRTAGGKSRENERKNKNER